MQVAGQGHACARAGQCMHGSPVAVPLRRRTSHSAYPDLPHPTPPLPFPGSYMSPELFLQDDVSPSLDIYSLGIIRELFRFFPLVCVQFLGPQGCHVVPGRRP